MISPALCADLDLRDANRKAFQEKHRNATNATNATTGT